MNTTTSFSKISRVEFEFKPDPSDPLYSFLQIHLFPEQSTRPHILYIFPSDRTTAVDHLHNIFLTTSLMTNSPKESSSSTESVEEPI
jgi:hypothetical protein